MTKRSNNSGADVKFASDFLDFFSDRRADTHAAFFINYVKPGMKILDCGCGPGSITLDFAEIVASETVIGIDIEPSHIEKAMIQKEIRKISNIEFHVGDINRLPYPNDTFDSVFTHGVIEYFQDPVHAFKEIRRVLKKGGVIGARHCDWGGFLLATANKYTMKGFSLFIRLMEKNGADPFFGRNQVSYLRKAGFTGIIASASYDCWTSTLETARRAGNFMKVLFKSEEYAKPVLESGFADKQTLTKIQASFNTWGEDPDIFAAEAWGEAVGWKE